METDQELTDTDLYAAYWRGWHGEGQPFSVTLKVAHAIGVSDRNMAAHLVDRCHLGDAVHGIRSMRSLVQAVIEACRPTTKTESA